MPLSSRVVAPGLVALTLVSCASEQNYSTAVCQSTDDGYEIALSGKRYSLSHSLILAMIEQTYEAKEVFHVPRASGVVYGAEIPTQKGFYRYGGTLEFSAGKLIVALHYVDTDRNQLVPLSWNGAYSLTACGAAQ